MLLCSLSSPGGQVVHPFSQPSHPWLPGCFSAKPLYSQGALLLAGSLQAALQAARDSSWVILPVAPLEIGFQKLGKLRGGKDGGRLWEGLVAGVTGGTSVYSGWNPENRLLRGALLSPGEKVQSAWTQGGETRFLASS